VKRNSCRPVLKVADPVVAKAVVLVVPKVVVLVVPKVVVPKVVVLKVVAIVVPVGLRNPALNVLWNMRWSLMRTTMASSIARNC